MIPVAITLMIVVAGLASWLSYLIFLDGLVKRHGPEVLQHIPGAVTAYRRSGALAWIGALNIRRPADTAPVDTAPVDTDLRGQ